jgi:hypothetical protein
MRLTATVAPLFLSTLLAALSTTGCKEKEEDITTLDKNVVKMLGYPFISVQARQQGETLMFSFSRCNLPNQQVGYVKKIEISRKREGEFERPPICAVELPKPLSADLMRVPEWQYGTTPKGWTKSGDCPPLIPGEYNFVVRGSGTGVRTFKIDANGKLDWTQSACPQNADAG